MRRISLANTNLLLWLLLASGVFFIVSMGLWWRFVFTDPQRVFEGMLANNYATSGYTRFSSVVNGESEQQQTTQIQFGAQNVAVTHLVMNNGQDKEKAEVISTPTTDFLRYTAIDHASSGANTESKAVGVWAKPDQSGQLSQSFNQVTLFSTYFPMGIMGAQDRQDLLAYTLSNTVYSPNYTDVKHETISDKQVYTYTVSVQLPAYVAMLKQFADATGQGNLLSGYDPANFSGEQPVKLEVSVDPLSRRIVRIAYVDKPTILEAYGGYGISSQKVTEPKKPVSIAELQKLLSQ